MVKSNRSPAPPVRPWPITLGGYLLVAQSAAGLGVGGALWQTAALTPSSAGLILAGGISLALAAVAFLNALNFFRQRRSAWLVAQALQSLSLAAALGLYWRGQALYAYPIMAYGVFLVFHLNRGDVLEPFRPRPAATSLPLPGAGPHGG